MTTNRRGFFGMFAGLLSAIGFTPKPDILTMDGLNQITENLSECEISNDWTICFWFKLNDGPWELKRMNPVEYEFHLEEYPEYQVYDAESR